MTFKNKCILAYNTAEKNVKLEPNLSSVTEDPASYKDENISDLDTSVIEEHLEEHLIMEDEDMNQIYIDETLENSQPRLRYTLNEKINAIKLSESIGNRAAMKVLSISESCIRKWRNQKADIVPQADESQERCRLSKNFLKCDEISEEFKSDEVMEIEGVNQVQKEVKPRNSYTSSQKLEAVSSAELIGNRRAAKLFNIDESCIRKWRRQKDLLTEITKERNTKRKPNLRFPEVEERLKEFVYKKMNDERTLLKPNQIRAESIRIAKELDVKNFKGTSSYVFKFMERYQIQSRKSNLKSE